MIILLAACLLVLVFGFVVLFGAPYVPTMKPQVEAALDLLALKKGQTLLELGCGDGRVLKAAAKRGLRATGYELNPLLVVVARVNTWRYHSRIRVIWGDYWRATWPPADAIFYFGLQKYMPKLHQKITQYKQRPLLLASFAFKLNNQKPSASHRGVYLYRY